MYEHMSPRYASAFPTRQVSEHSYQLLDVFRSAELYPSSIDINVGVLRFVRMTPETYRESVFLDTRIQHVGSGVDIRLNDLLLLASTTAIAKPVHYILNTAYCCSTLLARYFELLPSCLVLKEPRVLAQLAEMSSQGYPKWEELLSLCLQLLSRTFQPNQVVVIKPYEPCNRIGRQLLHHNEAATVSFLMTPLRSFLISILKLEERRNWVRSRCITALRDAAGFLPFQGVDAQSLTVPAAAACVWMANRYIYDQLRADYSQRVVLVDGDQLAESPEHVLPAVLGQCGLAASKEEVQRLIQHPSVYQYSKDVSRPFDAGSRRRQLADIERCWSSEVDEGMEWAQMHGGEWT